MQRAFVCTDNAIEKYLSYGGSFLIFHGKEFDPFGDVVYYGQDIDVPL